MPGGVPAMSIVPSHWPSKGVASTGRAGALVSVGAAVAGGSVGVGAAVGDNGSGVEVAGAVASGWARLQAARILSLIHISEPTGPY